ncbi:Rpn family recombination-promoting nuclease/putative transposase [Sporosarcina sp. FSL W7-1349]|uniref:Rpn family recombination-promoting nuclease/putative transposase n=1 Tax=Sporosarcina sp. FSL W7-1349 TaxID=2921561 RepID=UPI0030F93147
MVAMLVMEKPSAYKADSVDQDGLWKKVIGDLFEDFLLFFVPDLYERVDFTKKPDFLQQELFQQVVDKKKGRRIADQVVKVHLKDGQEQWILVHVEVQSSNEEDFSKRMFQYFYRIYDRHEKKIVAVAIMTSPEHNIYPNEFSYSYFGTTLHYAYTTHKIVDYDFEPLRRSENLFSKIVLAAKYMHATKERDWHRYVFKRKLMREVVRNRAYSRTAVQAILHFVDYLLRLPKEYEQKLAETMYPVLGKEKELMELYNKDNASPTISNAFEMERMEGIKEGELKGKMEERRNIARKLLEQQLPIETIIAATELSVEEVEALRVQFE